MLAILVFFGGFFASVVIFALTSLEGAHRETTERGLDAIALLKSRQIAHLFDQRKADTKLLANNPVFRELLAALEQSSAGNWRQRLGAWYDNHRVIAWIKDMRDIYGFHSAEVVGAKNTSLVVAGVAPYDGQRLSDIAIDSGAEATNVTHFQLEEASGKLFLLFAQPVLENGKSRTFSLIFSADASKFLGGLMQEWPNQSRTGRLLLFYKSEADIFQVFESAGSGGSVRKITSRDNMPDLHRAIRSGRGIYQGNNESGVPILAAIHDVKGSPFVVLCEVELTEVVESVRLVKIVCLILGLLGAVCAGTLLIVVWRQQQTGLSQTTEALRKVEAVLSEAASIKLATSDFLAKIRHEVRLPVTNVLASSKQLLEHGRGNSWEKKKLSEIYQSVNLLMSVVNEVIDASLTDAVDGLVRENELNIDDLLVKQVINPLRADASEKHLELVLEVDPALRKPLIGDATRIAQAVLHLTSNSVKFTESGRVKIHVLQEQQRANGCVVRIEVTDTGVGLAPEIRGKVAAAFSSEGDSVASQYEGGGLGLIVAARAAKLLGGATGFNSVEGLGSVFWITLALRYAEPVTVASMQRFRGWRALVSDNSPESRRASADVVTGMGMVVTQAVGGDEIVRLVEEASYNGMPFDLLLVDVNLKGVSLPNLLHRLHAHMERDSTRLLITTQLTDPELEERLNRLGTFGVIERPFSTDGLCAELEQGQNHELSGQSADDAPNGPDTGSRLSLVSSATVRVPIKLSTASNGI